MDVGAGDLSLLDAKTDVCVTVARCEFWRWVGFRSGEVLVKPTTGPDPEWVSRYEKLAALAFALGYLICISKLTESLAETVSKGVSLVAGTPRSYSSWMILENLQHDQSGSNGTTSASATVSTEVSLWSAIAVTGTAMFENQVTPFHLGTLVAFIPILSSPTGGPRNGRPDRHLLIYNHW